MILSLTYRCRACRRTFVLDAAKMQGVTPLLAQVLFHACDDEPTVFPRSMGVGDLISFLESEACAPSLTEDGR
jgi:hypothetical protein